MSRYYVYCTERLDWWNQSVSLCVYWMLCTVYGVCVRSDDEEDDEEDDDEDDDDDDQEGNMPVEHNFDTCS